MDKSQIDTVLNRLFHEQGKRIVFWREEPLIHTNHL
jgi:hypothetical protein